MGCMQRAGRPLKSARHCFLGFTLLFAICIAGCTSSRQYANRVSAYQAQSAAALEAQRFNESLAVLAAADQDHADYTIGPEDLLDVTMFDIQDREGDPRVVQSRVSNTGYVTLPLVGKVVAAGFTPAEFELHVQNEYKRFIFDPQITVFIREHRSYEISVVGYVTTPGVLQLRGRGTLLEALSMAGGLSDEAGRMVRLTRYGEDEILTHIIDLEQITVNANTGLNPELLPGDVITVPKAGMFYVEGMVTKAGAYPLVQDITVTQAIATAGGIDVRLARDSGTMLLRKQLDGRREAISINIASIHAGKTEDLVVQENDLIIVPVSGPKAVVDSLLGLVRVGVQTF